MVVNMAGIPLGDLANNLQYDLINKLSNTANDNGQGDNIYEFVDDDDNTFVNPDIRDFPYDNINIDCNYYLNIYLSWF